MAVPGQHHFVPRLGAEAIGQRSRRLVALGQVFAVNEVHVRMTAGRRVQHFHEVLPADA